MNNTNQQQKQEYTNIIENWQSGIINTNELEKQLKALNNKYGNNKYMLMGGRILNG